MLKMTPWEKYCYYSHCTDEVTESQSGSVTFLRPFILLVTKLGFQLRQSESWVHPHNHNTVLCKTCVCVCVCVCGRRTDEEMGPVRSLPRRHWSYLAIAWSYPWCTVGKGGKSSLLKWGRGAWMMGITACSDRIWAGSWLTLEFVHRKGEEERPGEQPVQSHSDGKNTECLKPRQSALDPA